MNKLKAMAIFVKIVDQGSLSKAAEKLGMSQSSVARSLAALEESVATQLIHRTTRKQTLTEEGIEFSLRCRQILADVDDAENALTQRQSKPKGLIRITAPQTFGRLHINPLISEFIHTYPEIEVELLLLDRVVDLIEEGMDIALRIGHLPDSTLIAKQVGKVAFKVCASPHYIEQAGQAEHPTELFDYECIQLTALKSHAQWGFREAGKHHKISISGRFKTNHVESALDACKQGLGYGQFLSYQVAESVHAGELKTVLESYESPPLPVNLVYPHSRRLSSRSRTFIDWIAPRLQSRLRAIDS